VDGSLGGLRKVSENARDYIIPNCDKSQEENLRDADTFMIMEFRIHKAVQEGLTTYDELADLVDAFISSKGLR
jgi:hypothetical protein